jgi:hypothetical protein
VPDAQWFATGQVQLENGSTYPANHPGASLSCSPYEPSSRFKETVIEKETAEKDSKWICQSDENAHTAPNINALIILKCQGLELLALGWFVKMACSFITC